MFLNGWDPTLRASISSGTPQARQRLDLEPAHYYANWRPLLHFKTCIKEVSVSVA